MKHFLSVLALLLFAGAVLGCASASSAIRVSDVKSLSGKWQGYAVGTDNKSFPAELIINQDGTTSAHWGAASSTGIVAVRDGRIMLQRTSATGLGGSQESASTAELYDRGGKRVLVGQGRTQFGPFSYELTEQK